MSIIVTGGAGFVGSSLCIRLKQAFPKCKIIALDNLKRRGSELNLSRLVSAGIYFQHADVRCSEDLIFKDVDWVIECSAEPSALSGVNGDTGYLINTNLMGTYNCLEMARKNKAGFLFLSTSRVYPYKSFEHLDYHISNTRFNLSPNSEAIGLTHKGVSEEFSTQGPKTLYGASKLASELLITEYSQNFDLRTIVNRCGVLAGPWQMGKVDQGFMALWMARHLFGGNLSYINYGGKGLQLRDVLHVQDLVDLVIIQLSTPELYKGQTFNVGGGLSGSISLCELTSICSDITGNTLEIIPNLDVRPGDLPWYVTDTSRIEAISGWRPKKSVNQILEDIYEWLDENRDLLAPIFSPKVS